MGCPIYWYASTSRVLVVVIDMLTLVMSTILVETLWWISPYLWISPYPLDLMSGVMCLLRCLEMCAMSTSRSMLTTGSELVMSVLLGGHSVLCTRETTTP